MALLITALLVRIPFLSHFQLVTYDGTSYVRQAQALLQGSIGGGAFPFGYPVFVALLTPILRDGVAAAVAVSLIANVVSVVVFYFLAKQFVRQPLAILGSVVLILCPVFMRASLLTMSESIYILWVLLGLWAYNKKRFGLAGLFVGVAAATRPEALAVFGILAVLKLRQLRPALRLSSMFVLVYAIHVLTMSGATGGFVMLSRQQAFGDLESSWRLRELQREGGEFAGKDNVSRRMKDEEGKFDRVTTYAKRLPREMALLHRQVLSPVFLLALLGFVRGSRFAMAALVPFLIFPAFTDDRGDPRWIVAYVPVLTLYAMVGTEALLPRWLRRAAYVAIGLGIAVSLYVNRAQLTHVEDAEFSGAREASHAFRSRVSPEDRIADRKPYFAFYAGAKRVGIPVAPYDETMADLAHRKVSLLSLHQLTAHLYRPALRPLVYDPLAIRGEIRFRQVHYQPTGEVIYERVRDDDALSWQRLTKPARGDRAPVWSPDGRQVAFRRLKPNGGGAICVVAAEGGTPRTIADTEESDDQICWAPDGRRVVFAAPRGSGRHIFAIDIHDHTIEQLTTGDGDNGSPSWTTRNEIVFTSNRSGKNELWIKDENTGAIRRLPDTAGARYPSACPTDDRIAWVHDGQLVILDRATARRSRVERPNRIASPPAWSPDGRFIALEADDWGSPDVYLVRADNGTGLLLTKLSRSGEGVPNWRNSGEELVIVSGKEGKASVWRLRGLGDYLARLSESYTIRTFDVERIQQQP